MFTGGNRQAILGEWSAIIPGSKIKFWLHELIFQWIKGILVIYKTLK